MRRAAVLAVAAAALAQTGCQRAKDPPASEERAATPRSKAPGSAKRPPIKAPAVVGDKRLGTLPEGVGLPVGSRVPDVTVKTHLGEEARLADLVKTGPLMLMFYRGGW